MKKFFNIFFVILGIIFFVLILAGTLFYVIDPYNLKPLLFGSDSKIESSDSTSTTQQDKNPILNEKQEKALETVGIDPANVPTNFTPEQESCFVEKIGAQRVSEIKAGDAPTASELIKGRNCL